MDIRQKKILSYSFYGFGLGLFFPIVSTLVELSRFGMDFDLSTIRTLHIAQPLMLVIDVAPIILAASFALIGLQAARFQETSIELQQYQDLQDERLRNEHYFLKALISSSSFAVIRLDTTHHIITCNEAFEELFGYKCDEIIGKHLDDMIASEDLQSEASMISDSVSSGNLVRKISQRMKKDGSLVDVEIVGVPVTVSGEKIGILGLYHDISQRINAEKALKESETRFRILFDESPISLWEEDFSEVKQFLDQIGDKEEIIKQLMKDFELANQCLQKVKIIDVNQATVDLYNANSKQQLIKGLADVLVVESLEQFRGELIALINDQTSHECEIYQKKITGELVYGWLRLSLPPGYEDTWERVFISILDITDRKQAEEKLRFLSFHDTLTGLYNRAYFEEELKRLSSSRQFPASIIVCDLDNLKQINDTLGHAVGDQAIKAAATILGMSVFRKEDVVARIGGDEYAVILPNVDINEKPEIKKRLEATIDLFNKNIDDDGLYRPISISCGYAVILPGGSLDEGFKEADANMYIAKQKKKM